MKVEFINSINEINKEEWNSIINSDYPFLHMNSLNLLKDINAFLKKEDGAHFMP